MVLSYRHILLKTPGDKTMQRRTFISATGAAAASLSAPMLWAQALPTQPIRIVVGFAPGGGTDILARVIAQKLSTMWNTTVLVENKAGAAGMIAAEYVARQPSDGTTLLMAHINSHAIAPALTPKMTYNVERDFTPVVLVGVTPNLLICNEQQTARTVKDVVELCRKNPGKISFGSAGNGSAQHLAMEMFKLAANIDAIHVPYKGSGPMLTDLIGGHVDVMFSAPGSVRGHIDAGRLRALGVTSAQPSAVLPGLPPIATSGLPGYESESMIAMFLPSGTPATITSRLNDAAVSALQRTDVKDRMLAAGLEAVGTTSAQLTDIMRSEVARMGKVIKAAGIRID